MAEDYPFSTSFYSVIRGIKCILINSSVYSIGLDPNGHISSEFPADALLKQQDNVWFALCGESPKRVAITLGVLNAAKTVAIIGTKQEKAKAVGSILDNGLISQIHEVAWCTIDQSEYQKLEEKAKN